MPNSLILSNFLFILKSVVSVIFGSHLWRKNFSVYIYSKLTSWRIVQLAMSGLSKKLEIFNSVVELVSVYMVDALISKKWSSNVFFHNNSMFSNASILSVRNQSIPVDNCSSPTSSNSSSICDTAISGTIFPTLPFFPRSINLFLKRNTAYFANFFHRYSLTFYGLNTTLKY